MLLAGLCSEAVAKNSLYPHPDLPASLRPDAGAAFELLLRNEPESVFGGRRSAGAWSTFDA
jgi:hypothetical protein